MGSSESTESCHSPRKQELCAITLSDAAVQRIPMGLDDNPLEKEQRNQNTDDYWRDRMECMETAYSDSVKLNDREFQRLEFAIKQMAPGAGKYLCPRLIEDTTNCYIAYPTESLNCTQIIHKLELCLDTIVQEKMRKRQEEERRKRRKVC